jgi:hypothetical protein
LTHPAQPIFSHARFLNQQEKGATEGQEKWCDYYQLSDKIDVKVACEHQRFAAIDNKVDSRIVE